MDDAQRLADYVYIIDAGRNVAEGTVAQLLQHNCRRHPTGTTSARCTSRPSPAWTSPASCPPSVEVRETRAGSYTATGALTPEDLAALTAWWAHHGIMPGSLSMEARSLEDVFLDISGREIR